MNAGLKAEMSKRFHILSDWRSIDWKKIERRVKNLRKRKLLEPYEGKLSRTVLRGGDDSDVISLPDVLTLKISAT